MLKLQTRASQAETAFTLHPEYKYADLVMAFDQALIENKRIAIVTDDDQEHVLDLKLYSAFVLTRES